MNNWLAIYWKETLIFLSPIVSWLLTKRHFEQKELEQKEIDINSSSSDVVSKNLNLYQKMIDDLEQRQVSQLERRDQEIEILRQENASLKIQISHLQNQLDQIAKKLAKYEKQH